MPAGEPHPYLYDAFISYRHAEPDRRWAKWLHGALETYRVPKRLIRDKGVPRRLTRVFRDEEEVPASANLGKEIETALEASRFLIVVCSPRTPQSQWVNREIERFREMGRGDRILALLIEGAPADSFPRSLREIRRRIASHDGSRHESIEEVEPLAADVRSGRQERPSHLKRLALIRLLACVLGCRFDDLWRRDARRRRAAVLRVGAVAATVLATMLGIYLVQAAERTRILTDSRDRLARQLEQSLRDRADALLSADNVAGASTVLASLRRDGLAGATAADTVIQRFSIDRLEPLATVIGRVAPERVVMWQGRAYLRTPTSVARLPSAGVVHSDIAVPSHDLLLTEEDNTTLRVRRLSSGAVLTSMDFLASLEYCATAEGASSLVVGAVRQSSSAGGHQPFLLLLKLQTWEATRLEKNPEAPIDESPTESARTAIGMPHAAVRLWPSSVDREDPSTIQLHFPSLADERERWQLVDPQVRSASQHEWSRVGLDFAARAAGAAELSTADEYKAAVEAWLKTSPSSLVALGDFSESGFGGATTRVAREWIATLSVPPPSPPPPPGAPRAEIQRWATERTIFETPPRGLDYWLWKTPSRAYLVTRTAEGAQFAGATIISLSARGLSEPAREAIRIHGDAAGVCAASGPWLALSDSRYLGHPSLRIVDGESLTDLEVDTLPDAEPKDVVFSPTGRTVAAVSAASVWVYDLKVGSPRAHLRRRISMVNSARRRAERILDERETAAAFLSDEELVALTPRGLVLLDAHSGTPRWEVEHRLGERGLTCRLFDLPGLKVVACWSEDTIELRLACDGRLLLRVSPPVVEPDPGDVAAGTRSRAIHDVWLRSDLHLEVLLRTGAVWLRRPPAELQQSAWTHPAFWTGALFGDRMEPINDIASALR